MSRYRIRHTWTSLVSFKATSDSASTANFAENAQFSVLSDRFDVELSVLYLVSCLISVLIFQSTGICVEKCPATLYQCGGLCLKPDVICTDERIQMSMLKAIASVDPPSTQAAFVSNIGAPICGATAGPV
jgi:hypothetical protein